MAPPLRRMATSLELPPPSPSQAPSFSQPTLEADDFVRWGKDSRSSSSGSGSMFGTSSRYPSAHVSRTSSEDSTLFPEDLSSEPEDSHSTARPARPHSRRPRPRPSDSAPQNDQPLRSLSGHGKPGKPSHPKLVDMLKSASEVLEEKTRLKKKRLEREVRKSRLTSRLPTKPYRVAPGERVSSVSGKTSRRVPGAQGKEASKPLDLEPMSIDPTPMISRKSENTASKVKDKGVVGTPVEDSMDIDSSVVLGDVSMNGNPWSGGVGVQSKSPPSGLQSSAKRMPPPPVPSKALNKPLKKKSPSEPTPSKTPAQPPPPPPPPTPLSLTQLNPLRKRTLGMTRPTKQTSAPSHSVLPANRKPFKSPLIKQEPGSSQSGGPPRSQSKMYPVPSSSTLSQHIYPTQKPAPTKSAPKPPKPKKSDLPEVIDITDDPDTSYDFSTSSSIDGEEFNRAMAEYDRGAC